MDETTAKPKSRKGFAAMDPEKRRALARLGGVRASEKGTAHRWTSKEAQEAGKKGGAKTAALAKEASGG